MSESKVKKRVSKTSSSKTKSSSKSDGKGKDEGESTKGRQRRSNSMDRSVLDSPSKQREPLRRTKSDSKNAHLKAGSRIKYLSKKEREESQVTGEPTTERDVISVTRSLDTPLTKKKKSYLNRRNLMKENKEKSQDAKSSVMNSLDNFLAKIDKDESCLVVDDQRSVYSDNGLKSRTSALRARRRESDDRSVSSAPMLQSLRRARRASENLKVKANAKKVSTWWNLNRDDGE
jgi:hypothetical protein